MKIPYQDSEELSPPNLSSTFLLNKRNISTGKQGVWGELRHELQRLPWGQACPHFFMCMVQCVPWSWLKGLMVKEAPGIVTIKNRTCRKQRFLPRSGYHQPSGTNLSYHRLNPTLMALGTRAVSLVYLMSSTMGGTGRKGQACAFLSLIKG